MAGHWGHIFKQGMCKNMQFKKPSAKILCDNTNCRSFTSRKWHKLYIPEGLHNLYYCWPQSWEFCRTCWSSRVSWETVEEKISLNNDMTQVNNFIASWGLGAWAHEEKYCSYGWQSLQPSHEPPHTAQTPVTLNKSVEIRRGGHTE